MPNQELKLSSMEKDWHKNKCDCKGSMKGKNIVGVEIGCPVVSFQSMVLDDWIELFKKHGVAIKDA